MCRRYLRDEAVGRKPEYVQSRPRWSFGDLRSPRSVSHPDGSGRDQGSPNEGLSRFGDQRVLPLGPVTPSLLRYPCELRNIEPIIGNKKRYVSPESASRNFALSVCRTPVGCEEAATVAQCDFWWCAGGVEWCDLLGGPCRCSGWEESCNLRCGKRQYAREPTPSHLRRKMGEKKLSRLAHHELSD